MKLQIKEIRNACGMTQEEAAEKLNYTQRAYANWENGTREPRLETLCQMADLYSVSVDSLLGRRPVPVPCKKLTADETELVEIYNKVGRREKHRLMTFAYELEHEISEEDAGGTI